MLTEKLTYEDIVTKTVEALFGAGLNRRTIQDSYCKYYGMLGKYLDARGIRHYDIEAIGEFLQRNEERYRKKEITKHHYCGLKRAIRILIEYVEGDVIVSPTIRHARPDIDSEYVFLTTQYPIRKLAEGTCLGFIFKKYEDNLQSTREMVSDFGILPMPKYDEQQEDYMNCPASFRMLTITIPVTNTRLELTGSVLEALSYYSKDTTVEAYYDANLQRKVSRDDESRHVLEIIFSTVTYDLIETYRWGDIFNIVCSNVEDPSSFVSQYTSGEPAMVADMEKTYTYFAGNQS